MRAWPHTSRASVHTADRTWERSARACAVDQGLCECWKVASQQTPMCPCEAAWLRSISAVRGSNPYGPPSYPSMRIRCNRRRRCGFRRSLHTMEFDVGFVPCASREPKGSMPALGARPGASRDRARALLGASNRGQIHPAHPETPRARISDNHKLRRSPCDLAKFWLFSGFVHKLASGFDGGFRTY